jgi:hypothetical protein
MGRTNSRVEAGKLLVLLVCLLLSFPVCLSLSLSLSSFLLLSSSSPPSSHPSIHPSITQGGLSPISRSAPVCVDLPSPLLFLCPLSLSLSLSLSANLTVLSSAPVCINPCAPSRLSLLLLIPSSRPPPPLSLALLRVRSLAPSTTSLWIRRQFVPVEICR